MTEYRLSQAHYNRERDRDAAFARVRTLQRSAKIALGKAERARQYALSPEERAQARKYDDKAAKAAKEMVRLNDQYELGYVVPPELRRWAQS